MWCAKCGSEMEDGAKFCGVCGAAVEAFEADAPTEPEDTGAEQPSTAEEPAAEAPADSAAPAAPETAAAPESAPAAGSGATEGPILSGKAKNGKTFMFLGVAALLVVAIIVGLAKLVSGGSKAVYAYATDDYELMFRKDLKVKTEPVELTDEGTGSVRFSKDGKYIYFFEEDDGGSYADLYVIRTADVGKKNKSPEKISSDVYLYQLQVLDKGGVLYLKGSSGDTDLHYYNGKESSRLAKEVDAFTVDEKQNYVYYTEWDDSDGALTLYRVALKSGDKETLLKEASVIYSDYDAEVLVYGEDNGDGTYDVYSKKPGGDRQSIVKDVDEVVDVTVDGGKVSLLYMTKEQENTTLYDFVTDRYASSDASASRPRESDYQTYTYYGYYSYYGRYVTDWDAYYAALEEWYPIENRNSIRDEMKNSSYNVTYYTLYRNDNGKTSEVADQIMNLRYAADEQVYLYQKYEGEIEAVVDLSELSYAGEVFNYIANDTSTWYQNVGGTESEFELDDDYVSIAGINVLNGSEAVLEVYDESYDRSLLSYSVGKTSLSYQSEITDDYSNRWFETDEKDKDVLYYYTDVSRDGQSGDLIRYNGGKTTVVKDVEGTWILENGAVFAIEDREYDSRHGRTEYSLYAVDKNGKKTQIADDISACCIVDAKTVLYVSDDDLFVWNGKDSERIARDVRSIWASKRADLSYYWCAS